MRGLQDHLPEAVMVFDHFHVVKLMNDKLSNLRHDLQREAEAEQKAVLKGTRWRLLKNPGNLDADNSEADRLREALAPNAPLAAAYNLKEDLRQLWSQPDQSVAWKFLEDWIARAWATGVQQLRQMANTLSLHREGLSAYCDVPIKTGPLEGTNTRTNLLQRTAYR